MLTNIRYILITALRDRLFTGLFIGILVATAISATLGGTALIEEKEMTLSFASWSARVILIVGLIVFICFHIRSSFDTKEIDVILSRPISRSNLILSYWLGFSFIGLLLAVPTISIIAIIGANDFVGFIGWSTSILLEIGLVVALSLFAAFTVRSAVVAVLGCMGFYILSRTMAFFVFASNSGAVSGEKFIILKWILQTISTVMPRLDFFGKSDWLIYGFNSAQDWHLFVIQTAIYIPILLIATMIDFRRKEF